MTFKELAMLLSNRGFAWTFDAVGGLPHGNRSSYPSFKMTIWDDEVDMDQIKHRGNDALNSRGVYQFDIILSRPSCPLPLYPRLSS